MNDIIDALESQHHELRALIAKCADPDWQRPTPCDGWDIGDVVLHMAQTDELAVMSAQGKLDGHANGFLSSGRDRDVSVDDAAARQVANERSIGGARIGQRWDTAARTLIDVLRTSNPSQRVTWVAGKLSMQTLATTRLSECWIHTSDVAIALGIEVAPTERLRHIARLAWRTLPYAFERAGLAMEGEVELHLIGPTGEQWDYQPDGVAVTTISGSAEDFCAVAARRVDPSATALVGIGPDAANVLRLVRTYAQ